MELVFTPEGLVRCVYSEEVDMSGLGPLSIRRASHVEANDAGQWLVDLRPVNGPVIGPFDRRSQALAAEAAWLHGHWLTKPSEP